MLHTPVPGKYRGKNRKFGFLRSPNLVQLKRIVLLSLRLIRRTLIGPLGDQEGVPKLSLKLVELDFQTLLRD
jgi:hypothetical protein